MKGYIIYTKPSHKSLSFLVIYLGKLENIQFKKEDEMSWIELTVIQLEVD